MASIEKLGPSRWRDYRRLRLESLKESPLAFGSSFGEEARLKEGEWKKRMKDVYFAVIEGEPIGMILCSFNEGVKFSHIAEIFSFYVNRDYRGRGIGVALLDHALRLARNNKKVVKARLYVNGQQRAALRMYERAGFKVSGRLVREMKVGRRFYTMLVMEKRIR